MTVQIAQQPDADALLDRDPLALLVGMLLDQQFPMERAFAGPYVLAQRMGVDHLNAYDMADYDPEKFATLFVGPPAIHRFPGAMAGRVQGLARLLVADYDGRAEAVWEGAKSGAELHARVATLPGFGQQKARIFVALLGKQRGVRPRGWREAAGAYGEDGSFRSVADVVSPESLQKVRDHKKELKAAARAGA
ncbi:MAG TPA: HhH-GPD-type base excision DNA repair protein [Acidothermaceae bacterium]|nr:HhH-GPD-type base excision DNA repair protein [Acidothermaceae bacterium]